MKEKRKGRKEKGKGKEWKRKGKVKEGVGKGKGKRKEKKRKSKGDSKERGMRIKRKDAGLEPEKCLVTRQLPEVTLDVEKNDMQPFGLSQFLLVTLETATVQNKRAVPSISSPAFTAFSLSSALERTVV